MLTLLSVSYLIAAVFIDNFERIDDLGQDICNKTLVIHRCRH
jgi:hypothetical protein